MKKYVRNIIDILLITKEKMYQINKEAYETKNQHAIDMINAFWYGKSVK